jgi:hypothetical protein
MELFIHSFILLEVFHLLNEFPLPFEHLSELRLNLQSLYIVVTIMSMHQNLTLQLHILGLHYDHISSFVLH